MKLDISYKLVSEMIQGLEAKLDERFDKIEAHFVSKAEFAPYRAALNTAGMIFMAAILGALIYLIAVHPGSLQAI